MAETFEVVDNPEELRFELRRNDELAGVILYRRAPGIAVLVHTDISPGFEGRGFGHVLVKGALDDLRRRGLRVVPVCPFVASYIRHHPEYLDLVGAEHTAPE
jgi:predicted GNAT family acetyltransferase